MNLATILLVACSTQDGEGDDSNPKPTETDLTDTDTDTETPSETGTDPDDTGTETDPPIETRDPGLYGVVVGPIGLPVAGLQVLGCTLTTCLTDDSDDHGRFSFFPDPGDTMAVKTHEGDGLATGVVPIVVEAGVQDIGRLYCPTLPDLVEFSGDDSLPSTLSVGDGLELTLVEDDLKAPIGVFLQGIGAGRIPSDWQVDFPDLVDERIIDIYVLTPWALTSSSPIGVTVPVDVSVGGTVNIRVLNQFNGVLSEPVVATSDGATATTDLGEGVDLLTWIVVSEP